MQTHFSQPQGATFSTKPGNKERNAQNTSFTLFLPQEHSWKLTHVNMHVNIHVCITRL